MENWDSVWREIQEHERKNEISASDKLYQYLNNRVNYIKGPLKYEVCLTNQCNQHCLHCSNGLINKTSIFNCESMKPILDQEPVMIVLTGGEPLLHPQINSLISMIKKQGAFLKLCTNGIGLTEVVCNDLADRFEKYDIIQISFDAADKEIRVAYLPLFRIFLKATSFIHLWKKYGHKVVGVSFEKEFLLHLLNVKNVHYFLYVMVAAWRLLIKQPAS